MSAQDSIQTASSEQKGDGDLDASLPDTLQMSGDKAKEKDPVPPQPDMIKKTTGTAPIKQEYIDHNHKRRLATEYLPATAAENLIQMATEDNNVQGNGEPPAKKKKIKGRNKFRPREKGQDPSEKLCPAICRKEVCRFGENCKFMHDIPKYMASKPADLGDKCYIFRTYGKCPFALTCRFAGDHTTKDLDTVENEELVKKCEGKNSILNALPKSLQRKLWKRAYNFKKAEKTFRAAKDAVSQNKESGQKVATGNILPSEPSVEVKSSSSEGVTNIPRDISGGKTDCGIGEGKLSTTSDPEERVPVQIAQDIQSDEGVIRLRAEEKKKIDFSDKLYLAPLTTVGNLPFRRVCKQYGADITCGEMAMATNLLQGQQSEWALLKRHESEDIFGVQVCGSYPDSMARCTQLLCENIDVDFIDINCGCPIDLVFKRGEGCALMSRAGKFQQVVQSMLPLMDIPLTVKIRTGIFENKSIAHNLVPKLRDWGVSLVTLHGRSREQRYTRLADWDYIDRCAQAAKPMPLFGNGDILSYEDAVAHRSHTGVAGLMVARGALIKPWVFTEIKEQRHWDISSSERLDMLRQFANYGLDHWGSDQQGVASTRRFLLEWLSFQHRYIPVGLLERLPQKINEKPPYFFGRDDLETLMASGNCADWVKISEMLLGPVPANFAFLPKHRANAYS